MSARRIAAIATAAGLLLAASGSTAAWAYWSSTGTGTGSGATGTSVAMTLATGTAAGDLYPGSAGTVSTKATNTAAGAQTISAISLDTAGIAVDAAHSAGCPASNFTFTAQSNGGSGWAVPASGTLVITMAGSLALSATAPSACQGATVTLALKAS